MKKYRTTAFILLFLFSIFLVAGCSKKLNNNDSAKAAEPKNVLTVGMYLSYAPFETVDSQGDPEGFSVALAEELGKSLNIDIEIINIPYDKLIDYVAEGKIDMAISSIPITEERLALVDFSEPYARVKYSILLNKTLPIKSLEYLDNPNYTVAVKKGSVGSSYASQKLSKASIKEFDTDTEAAEAVVNSYAEAFIQDELTIFKHWKLYPVATHISFAIEDTAQSWGIAISKKNPELKEKVNSFLESFKKYGGFDKLSKKYLSKEVESYKTWKVPFIFDFQ